jgi:hypothetical protein
LVIDGNGHTLLPGLIDAHTHSESRRDLLERSLIFGVTTNLDMLGSPRFAADMRTEQAETGALDRADLYSSGILATAPGGHGAFSGVPTITSPSDAPGFVEDRVAEGSDYIKISYSAWGAEGQQLFPPSLDRATLGAVIRAAHERQKLAVVHAVDRRSAREALLEGADGLVHTFYIDQESEPPGDFGQLAASQDGFVVPTSSWFAVIQQQTSAPPEKSPGCGSSVWRSTVTDIGRESRQLEKRWKVFAPLASGSLATSRTESNLHRWAVGPS